MLCTYTLIGPDQFEERRFGCGGRHDEEDTIRATVDWDEHRLEESVEIQ